MCTNLNILSSLHINVIADHIVDKNYKFKKNINPEVRNYIFTLQSWGFFFLIFYFVIKLPQIHKKCHTNWDNSQFGIEKGHD